MRRLQVIFKVREGMREEAGYREAPASQNKLWSPLRREDDGEGARLVQRFYLLDLEKQVLRWMKIMPYI